MFSNFTSTVARRSSTLGRVTKRFHSYSHPYDKYKLPDTAKMNHSLTSERVAYSIPIAVMILTPGFISYKMSLSYYWKGKAEPVGYWAQRELDQIE